MRYDEEIKPNTTKIKLIGLGIVAFILLIILLSTFRTIDSGEVGVVTSFGKVTGRILDPGLSMVNPFTENVIVYNTKKVIYETTAADKQKGSYADYKDFPVDTNTTDGQQVDVSYTVRFSVDPTKATWVAKNIGSEGSLVEKIVKTESRIWVRNIVREYTADQLYTGNVAEVQEKINNQIKPTFEANGLLLDSVGIREIKFSDQYAQAIEAKQIEAVKVETEKNKAEQLRQVALVQIETERNNAEKAKFEKEQRITLAEAAAKEQELQRSTISSELLQKMLIEKWDGHYPQYMVSGNGGSYILPLPQK